MNEEERLKLAKEMCDNSHKSLTHEWRQKLKHLVASHSMEHDGYYCIYCLKEVK